jgi:hypothetical protein
MPGHRFALALTDSASAARYGLRTARLVNGAGQAVAPTDASILAGIATMKDSDVAGVKIVDPTVRVMGAYPLTMLTYAGINVCAASAEEIASYTQLLTFATGAGQVSGDAKGQLPQGYVPLTAALASQAAASVVTLNKNGGGKGDCAPPAPVAATPTAVESSSTTESISEPTPEVTAIPTADPEELATGRTVDQALPISRLSLAAALALGIPTMIVGPFLTRRGRRLASLEEID